MAALSPPANAEPRAARGEPVGPLIAALRHPILALVPFIVLVVVAAAIGLAHRPTYTAEARLSVGRVNVPAFTVQGVIQGNATLAINYARAINAQPVFQGASQQVGVSPGVARDALSASPVPDSTLIRVEASAHDRSLAVRLANAGATSLATYVNQLNTDPTPNLLAQYRQVQITLQQIRSRIDGVKFHQGSPGSAQQTLRQYSADYQTARLQALDLSNRYQYARSNASADTAVQLLVSATTANSDSVSVLERVMLIGVVGGLVLGATLALLRANRAWLRPGTV